MITEIVCAFFALLLLLLFAYAMCCIINKFMGEENIVVIYVVLCNGVVSSEGYKTLKKAQKFCKSRADKPEMVGNGWCFMSSECIYVIREIRVEQEK